MRKMECLWAKGSPGERSEEESQRAPGGRKLDRSGRLGEGNLRAALGTKQCRNLKTSKTSKMRTDPFPWGLTISQNSGPASFVPNKEPRWCNRSYRLGEKARAGWQRAPGGRASSLGPSQGTGGGRGTAGGLGGLAPGD